MLGEVVWSESAVVDQLLKRQITSGKKLLMRVCRVGGVCHPLLGFFFFYGEEHPQLDLSK